jgi:3-hydroxy-9,10-secoandrosta-1,3,5(10)-triene-9,17-dione monooxygenase
MASRVPLMSTEARPSAEDLVARARALRPEIAARAAEADAARDVPADIVARIQDAGLFGAFRPAAWGGLELDPQVVLDIQNEFAEVCVSTAWIYGVLSVQSFLLARFDPQAQADVWGDNPDTLVSSSFQPVGKVTPAEGGFRISGRYTYSSGSSHCDWAVVGGIVPPGAGREAPEMRLFLIPRSSYRIDDTWQVIGLKATGSNDIVLDDVFVPAYRTYKPDGGLKPVPASSGLPRLYRMPWLHIFTSMVSNLGVGAGRGALAAFTEVTRTRTAGFTNAPSRENAAFLSVMARARAEIDASDLLAKRNFARMLACVDADEDLSLPDALLCRAQLTGSMRKIAALVDEMMLLLGARGIKLGAPLTRIWLDLMAARAHPGNDPSAIHAQLAGEMLAGH